MNIISNKGVIKVPDELSEELSKEFQIEELKQRLSDTNYIAYEIAEGVATKEEYADIIKQRQDWREKINKLEREVII